MQQSVSSRRFVAARELKAVRYVVGLGNPGPKYAETRHNFGFLCLEALSLRLKAAGAQMLEEATRAKLAHWEHWRLTDSQEEILLLWPLTYMNLSGEAVSSLRSRFPVEDSEIFLVIDDMSLPLGQLRLRRKGSSGGHNGLKSIESVLGHQEYPRLRLGIGEPTDRQDVVDFVLEPFSDDELESVEAVRNFSAECVADWAQGVSFEALMGKVNGWRMK